MPGGAPDRTCDAPQARPALWLSRPSPLRSLCGNRVVGREPAAGSVGFHGDRGGRGAGWKMNLENLAIKHITCIYGPRAPRPGLK